jgi:tRNA pseudouridine55 synthase
MDGFVNVYKNPGMTSHDVVYRLRRATGIKRIGHAGTLDPDAEGVLVAAIGRATRILPYLTLEPKVYDCWFRLGITTDTQDASGTEQNRVPAGHITEDKLKETLQSFIGLIKQIPPMFSAVHHEGQRLYDLARKGIEVVREPREVTIESIVLKLFESGEFPLSRIIITCSSGTYVRTLCHDIGNALGVGGHMEKLIRTRVGDFCVEESHSLDDLQTPESVQQSLIGIIKALYPTGGPVIQVNESDREHILNGNFIAFPPDIEPTTKPIPLVYEAELLAIAIPSNDHAQPVVVFNPPAQTT